VYALEILGRKDSADEWALALRNYARGPAPDGPLLEEKVVELLSHPPWLEHPSAGFLEAFDTPVFVGSLRFVPMLAPLIQHPPHRAVRKASWIALDRWVTGTRGDSLPELATGEALGGQPLLRAGLMARADVRDPAQRQAVERYLNRNDIQSAEFDKFAGLFPNANGFVSHNLLTGVQPFNPRDSVARDLASLHQVRAWRQASGFAAHAGRLARTEAHLHELLESAVVGGLLPAGQLPPQP
jgi:hypothetical protein